MNHEIYLLTDWIRLNLVKFPPPQDIYTSPPHVIRGPDKNFRARILPAAVRAVPA